MQLHDVDSPEFTQREHRPRVYRSKSHLHLCWITLKTLNTFVNLGLIKLQATSSMTLNARLHLTCLSRSILQLLSIVFYLSPPCRHVIQFCGRQLYWQSVRPTHQTSVWCERAFRVVSKAWNQLASEVRRVDNTNIMKERKKTANFLLTKFCLLFLFLLVLFVLLSFYCIVRKCRHV